MGDEAVAIVEVGISPAAAFDVFTTETGDWWRGNLSLTGHSGPLRFEVGAGGRVLARDGVEVGRVRVWEPGPRLVFGYASGEVEVRFEAVDGGTRVVLRHHGFEPPVGDGHWAGVLAGFARRSAEHVLLGRLGEFLDAIGAGDQGFFERNLTEDALLIFPGCTYSKRECVALMRDHPPYVKYEVDEPRIVHHGETSAVISYRAEVMNTGNAAPRNVVVTSVLVRDGDVWRMALSQWTPADGSYQ